MPEWQKTRYSGSYLKLFTMKSELCSRRAGIRVHDALETLTTMSRNMQAAATAARMHADVRGADYFRAATTTSTTTDEGDDDPCLSNPRSIH